MTDSLPSPTDAVLAALQDSTLAGHAGEALRLLKDGRNVVLYGPPGTGKTFAAFQVRDWWRATNGEESVVLTTFHPSYAYEDFVEGFRPDSVDPTRFRLTDGVLFEAMRRATEGGHDILLLIDEINRGDVAKIFGELITYIERDKRDQPFTTAQRPNAVRTIPGNLYFLGTMNTADKSISLLDVALRRRFSFINCPPDPTAYVRVAEWADAMYGVPLADVLIAINRRLLAASVERDRLVGHAILSIPDGAPASSLFDRFRYDLLPLVEEYLFNNQVEVARVLPGLVDADGLVATELTAELMRQLAGSPESNASVVASTESEIEKVDEAEGLVGLDDDDQV